MEISAASKRVCATLATTILLALALSSMAEARTQNVSGDLLNPGVLVVGTDSPFPPFEFGPAPGYRGFDIDVVNALADEMDLRVRIKDTQFDTIFTDLRRRKFDLVAAAATITPERKRVINFSRPYYDAQQSLVVRTDSDIDSVKDLAGATVAVQDGTTGELFAWNRTRAAKVIGFPNGFGALKALKRTRFDATIVDQPVAMTAIDDGQTGIRVAKNISTGTRYGLATSKATPRLLKAVNRALRTIKADGTFERIYLKWFGIKPPASLTP